VGRNDGGSAGCQDGPHHHGELETVLYVVKAEFECDGVINWNSARKPGLETLFTFTLRAAPGDQCQPDEICEAVVVRDGQDPIVVNLDLRTPEPASAGRPGMPFHPDR